MKFNITPWLLVCVSLVAQVPSYPVYKKSDSSMAERRDSTTKASRAQESQRALDFSSSLSKDIVNQSSAGPVPPAPRPPDEPDPGSSDLIVVVIPVYRDGYRVSGAGQATYSEWAPGAYMGGASITNWGGRMVVPFWNPEKATFQIGPDLGVQQAQTFWWPGRTPVNLPFTPYPKPYFAKPTYHHGVNTVSNFQTYWVGYFSPTFGSFVGIPQPAFAVLNNAHNEGGMDHPNIAMVSGFPTAPYQAGVMAQWTENHSEWYWPSPGSCYMTSMELWDSVRTGYGSAPFTFQVECISGVQDNGQIEIPVTSLNGLLGQNRVVEEIQLTSPIKVEKYTKTTYVTRRIWLSDLNGTTQDAYIQKASTEMSQKAVVWPEFRAEAPTPHNVGSAVFLKATMKMVQ